MILPGCRAVAPVGELRDDCREGYCHECGGPACLEHDGCFGCGMLLCQRCDTQGGMPPTLFPGDLVPHPHNAR